MSGVEVKTHGLCGHPGCSCKVVVPISPPFRHQFAVFNATKAGESVLKTTNAIRDNNNNKESANVNTRDSLEHIRVANSIWLLEYANDIYNTLRDSELRRRKLNFQSAQITFRPAMLNLMKHTAICHNLARTTLHLAVYLLDCFMDMYPVTLDRMELVALTCVFLASKVEDIDCKVPSVYSLNSMASHEYDKTSYKSVERMLLDALDFDVMVPTVATFAEHICGSFITNEDYEAYCALLKIGQDSCMTYYETYESFQNEGVQFFFELVDMALSHYPLHNVRPSVIAAACMAAVRHIRHIYPIWSAELTKLTCVADVVMQPFLDIIIELYQTEVANYKLLLKHQSPLPSSEDSGCPDLECEDSSELCDQVAPGSLKRRLSSSESDSSEVDEYEDSLNNDYYLHPLNARPLVKRIRIVEDI